MHMAKTIRARADKSEHMDAALEFIFQRVEEGYEIISSIATGGLFVWILRKLEQEDQEANPRNSPRDEENIDGPWERAMEKAIEANPRHNPRAAYLVRCRERVRRAKELVFRAQDREGYIDDGPLCGALLRARNELEAADRRLQELQDARELEAALEAG